ncbi:MAG: FumA C-terminus/TtdB family hydratase beta subunit [Treponema sp.]|jgi:fumarate hydratase class I|nr:FumA C-terminus/TtdB family hydratase beta subunit [Treponema sp.]
MDLFPFIKKSFEKTSFRSITIPEATMPRQDGERLFIEPELLKQAAEEAFRDLAFYFRENQLRLLGMKLLGADDEGANSGKNKIGDNDRFVIESLLANTVIAARGEFPLCQDTGTAIVYAWKDEGLCTGARDSEALKAGAKAAYSQYGLRFSQVAPKSFLDEYNTGDNLPAQIHIEAVPSKEADPVYRFLFVAKGGGSTNKTAYFASTPALLQHDVFLTFLEEKIKALGTAGCPPYRIAVVAGGLSPEQNLEVLKLATAEALDTVPYFETPGIDASLFIHRDKYWEEKVMEIGRNTGLGAQFGGKNFILDARVLRLPRHAATFPVSIGVSCVAHRNMYAYIDKNGLHLEKLINEPKAFLETLNINIKKTEDSISSQDTQIDINLPMRDVCKKLSHLSPGDKIFLTGKLIVARDLAHLKWHHLISQGKDLPEYVKNHPVYYAGPAGTPPGRHIGSLGPTTAQRMDPYGEELLSRGYSLISLAKGNRTQLWTQACKNHGGFFLGTIGGAAALLAQYVTANELVDYPELGMEAVRLISVEKLPAFIIIDDKGNDLYRGLGIGDWGTRGLS